MDWFKRVSVAIAVYLSIFLAFSTISRSEEEVIMEPQIERRGNEIVCTGLELGKDVTVLRNYKMVVKFRKIEENQTIKLSVEDGDSVIVDDGKLFVEYQVDGQKVEAVRLVVKEETEIDKFRLFRSLGGTVVIVGLVSLFVMVGRFLDDRKDFG